MNSFSQFSRRSLLAAAMALAALPAAAAQDLAMRVRWKRRTVVIRDYTSDPGLAEPIRTAVQLWNEATPGLTLVLDRQAPRDCKQMPKSKGTIAICSRLSTYGAFGGALQATVIGGPRKRRHKRRHERPQALYHYQVTIDVLATSYTRDLALKVAINDIGYAIGVNVDNARTTNELTPAQRATAAALYPAR